MAELYRHKPFYGGSECLFVGTTEQCNKMKVILDEYHKYDSDCPEIEVVEPVEKGTQQEYIEKVLDETIDFKYGY